MKALVVDDSSMLRMLVSKLLRGAGYEIAEAADGQQALDRVAEDGPPDLVLLDWNMPVMNGYEFLVRFRAEAANAGAKVVLLTTESQRENIVQALDAGADDYVTKPFESDALLEKIERVMSEDDIL